MRRVLIAVAALAFFAAAALAGLTVAARLGPERLRVELEKRLTAELGPVAIGAVHPFFAWGLGVELVDLRVGGDGGGALAAERVWITVSPRSLLRGEPRARRVDVRGLRVDAIEGADGAWSPAAIERARGAAPRGEAQPAASVRSIASALPAISIEDGTLHATRVDGTVYALQLEHLSLSHDPLGGAPALRAAGRLAAPTRDGVAAAPGDLGAFELDAKLDDPSPHGSLALTDVALAALPPAWLGPLRATGRVSGVASWTPASSGGALDLDLLGLEVRLARAGETDANAAATSFATARLRTRVEIDAHRIQVPAFEWNADALALHGKASIERPIAESSKLTLELGGESVAVPALRDLARIATPKTSPARANLDALRAGDIASFTFRADAVPLDRLRAQADPKTRQRSLAWWTEGITAEIRVDGVEIRVGGGDPIRDLSGRFALAGERLRIDQARAKVGDRPLPMLSLDLDGLGAALAALQGGVVPPAVPPLPGRFALDRWIDSTKRPGSPPRWRRIEVRADWIEHPVLLRPLEEVTAVLTPANPGVHIDDAKGFWGGVPFEGSGSIYGGDKSRIEVVVSLALPRRTGRRRADAEVWGRARFHADLEKLGDFQAESLEGVVQASGDRVLLRRGEARLRPRGDLAGTVDLDLSDEDRVPYRARIELDNGSVSDLMNDVKLDGGAARGTAEIDVDLDGFVQAGHNVLADMNGTGSLRMRQGEFNKRMNILFSIAQVTDTLNPFRSRETIPYDSVDAPIVLKSGIASTEALSLQGPALRMVGTGQVDLVKPPFQVEAVIGIFYFKALDRVIGIFPLLNRMLLGPDDNLVSTYFAVSGPWADPRGTLIPVKSFASGPASFVLEGLPSFVRGGLSTLERVLTGSAARSEPAKPQTTPAPPSAASGGPS